MDSDLGIALKRSPENKLKRLRRLRGGTSRTNLLGDDLPLDDFGEAPPGTSGAKGKKQVQINAPDEAQDPEAKSKSKAILIRNYIIITLLVIIWIIYTVCLMLNREYINEEHILAVPPNETKDYRVKVSKVKHDIGVQVSGPFLDTQDLSVKPSTHKPQLFLQMYIEENQRKMVPLSKKWSVIIKTTQPKRYVKSTNHYLDVKLNKDLSILRYNKQKFKVYVRMHTNIPDYMSIKVLIDQNPIDKRWGIAFGAVLLIFLYAFIIWEVINRTLASLVAATLAVGILAGMGSRPSINIIIEWINVETLMLLFGMMVLVGILSESGVFDFLAVFAFQVAKGNLWAMIAVLCASNAVLSAILDNVTMMLLMTPVTIRLCEVTNLNPVIVLMSMVVASNIGAALTPVGDPPNIIIMTNAYVQNSGSVNFGNFIAHMAPGVFISLITVALQVRLTYRNIKHFMNKESLEIEAIRHQIIVWERAAQHMAPTTTDEQIVQNTLYKKAEVLKEKLQSMQKEGARENLNFEETLAQMKANYPIRNKTLLIKATIAFAFVVILFCMHAIPNVRHIPLGWSALLGALLLLIIADEEDIDAVLARMEWSTLLFFACLFILMESLSKMGLIDVIGNFVFRLIALVNKKNQLLVAMLLIIWVTALASAFLNNVPVTTMMVRIVVNLCQTEELKLPIGPLVWSMAFGACFGGNGTLLGASANVVASGVAEQHGYRFNFMRFLIFAFPLTINSLIVATIYLLLAHCAFTWH